MLAHILCRIREACCESVGNEGKPCVCVVKERTRGAAVITEVGGWRRRSAGVWASERCHSGTWQRLHHPIESVLPLRLRLLLCRHVALFLFRCQGDCGGFQLLPW